MSSRELESPKIVVVQTVIPDYRERFYALLDERLQSDLQIVAGDEDFAPALKSSQSAVYSRVENRFLLGRRLLWQSGTVPAALRADIAVLVLNPRIVTVWVALVLRRLRSRRTVLWGHAWPRRGRGSRTDFVRNLLRRLADTLVVYTEAEALELRERMPRADVVAAPNALYFERETAPAITSSGSPSDFVCVGRLVPAKKVGLLLEAFALAANRLPADVRLVFVGDGPLRATLEAAAEGRGIRDRVVFLGHEANIDELRPVYAEAIAAVSPGYVGLSLIQSLGFGVPMLAARDEPHAPEITAAVEGDNVRFFPSDSPGALASQLVTMAEDREFWLARREAISRRVRETYSVERMVSSFISALRLDRAVAPAAEASQSTRISENAAP